MLSLFILKETPVPTHTDQPRENVMLSNRFFLSRVVITTHKRLPVILTFVKYIAGIAVGNHGFEREYATIMALTAQSALMFILHAICAA